MRGKIDTDIGEYMVILSGDPTMHDVLVVDDDQAIVEMVSAALAMEAIPHRTAANGREALDRVREARPSLILLDLNMPVVDGKAFCDGFDQDHGRDGTVVILMTAAQDARTMSAQLHADAVLTKPFDINELFTVVERYFHPSVEPHRS